MLETVLPKIEIDAISQQYGRFMIGPMESGFGITVGNALRRVLLSSLPGAAVTSIKVNNVHHEFSPIPGAKEDTTQLILNVKRLRLRSHSENSVRLFVETKGEGVISAADIESPSDVEIVNVEQELLTLDSEDAELEMELVVERGRGYSPAEERGKLPIGEIPVDAIFSPIRKVDYDVEPARVGQSTSYDELHLDIWTDGTIRPKDALIQAGRILVDHFSLVAGLEGESEELDKEEEGIPEHIREMPIDELDLSVRAYNCLKRAGISDVGQILERLEEGDDEMLAIRNFGVKSLEELKEALKAKDVPLPEDEEE